LQESSDKSIELEISYEMIENLKTFSEILNKDINTILDEALTQYFTSEQKRLLEKNQDDENMMTNLDYDEFWDGVEF